MGTYELKSELGRGGMGVVHRAVQVELKREVALKLLLPGADTDSDDTVRFKREVEALMALTHPNIVRVLDCGELDGRWFYTMELIQGQTLERLIETHGKLEMSRALKVARQAAAALAACHAGGFTHRDIKPGNLMISGADHVTLMDFGLVKVENRTVLTATGEVMGTPFYVGPELLRGDSVSPASDVYALGVLFIEMLGGTAPFRSESMAALLTEILTKGPKPVAEVRPDTPAPFGELVRRMVVGDPAGRPTAAQVVAELDRIASGSAAAGTGLASGSTPRRTNKSGPVRSRITQTAPAVTQRSTPARAFGALAGVALLATGGGLAWRARRPAPPVPATAAPSVAVVSAARAPLIEVYAPRRAFLSQENRAPWPAGTAWVATEKGKTISEGRLDRPVARIGFQGLEPGRDYQVDVSGAGGPVSVLVQMPRMALAEVHLEPGETTIGVSLGQTGHDAFVLTLEAPDHRVIWTDRTSEPSYFNTVRDCRPDTRYRLRVKAERAGVAYAPETTDVTTLPAGHVKDFRAKLRSMGELSILASASDLGRPWVSPAPELLPDVLETLRAAVTRTDFETIYSCLEALGSLHDPRAFPAVSTLVEALQERSVIKRALECLGQLRQPAGFDLTLRLSQFVKRESGDDNYPYMQGLVGSDPRRARERFLAVMREPERYSELDRRAASLYMALYGVDELLPWAVKEAMARLDVASVELCHHLGFMGGAAARAAVRTLTAAAVERKAPVLEHAVRALGRVGDATDGPLLAQALGSADVEVRRAAVAALGLVGGAVAEVAVLPRLDDPDPHVRRRAAIALGRMRARAAVEPLLARLATDGESRGRIPRALGLIGDVRAVPGLLERLKRPSRSAAPRDADDVDRAEALWALGLLKAPEARAIAERELDSPSDYARLRAAEALGWLGAREALPAVLQAAKRKDDALPVRAALERTRGWLEGKGAPPAHVHVIDAVDTSTDAIAQLFPGEGLRVQITGGWMTEPTGLMWGAGGFKNRKKDLEMRLWLRCRSIWVFTELAGPLGLWTWYGGPVYLEQSVVSPDAAGFFAYWID